MPHESTPAQAGSFFEQHHAELTELGVLLGLPTEIRSNLASAVKITQPWVAGDHTRPENGTKTTVEQEADLTSLFERFSLEQAAAMPSGYYDHIVVPGAVQRGNNGRLQFLRQTFDHGDIAAGDIVLMGGQRHVFGEVEAALLEKDLAAVEEAGTGGPWVANFSPDIDGMEWETDFMRLAALKHLGPLTLERLHLRLGTADPIKRYEFTWRDTPLRLMHTLAVARAKGAARHTTEACIEEWMTDFKPRPGARVGFIASNPHRDRMGKAAQRKLDQLGRQDIELVIAGPAAAEGLKPQIYLGEIARNLYEDTLVTT